jgi:hypothetical protein
LGIHFDPQAVGFLPALAAVLSAALINEIGHMTEVGIRFRRLVLPRLGMGGVLGARFYVPNARGWSGMAANALALVGLVAAFAAGSMAAPVAVLGILANLIFALGPTDVADFIRQIRRSSARSIGQMEAQSEIDLIDHELTKAIRLKAGILAMLFIAGTALYRVFSSEVGTYLFVLNLLLSPVFFYSLLMFRWKVFLIWERLPGSPLEGLVASSLLFKLDQRGVNVLSQIRQALKEKNGPRVLLNLSTT